MATKSQIQKWTKKLDGHIKEVGAARNKLDDTIDEMNSLLNDCDEALDSLQVARDALSRLA